MENVINTILQTYGIYGLLLLAIITLGYMIWGDRKNNWGNKIDNLCNKVDSLDEKIAEVKHNLNFRIESVENKISQLPSIHSIHEMTSKEYDKEIKKQFYNQIESNDVGKISKKLKYYCKKIGCDHIFLGILHNGTQDVRGIHWCKFDIILDEFKDPLHLHKNDLELQPLYRDENIIAYGDLPYKISHVDAVFIPIHDESNTLLELSDTLYRRCNSRDVHTIGLAGIRDHENSMIGFVGCISFEDVDMSIDDFKACTKELESLFNK